MSPVAEREAPTADQPLVSQPDKSALFMATRSNLRLVWESMRTIRDAEGVAVDRTAGKTLEFKDGVLRIPLEPGAQVTCTNGERCSAADALKFLEGHRAKGDWLEGFWRVDPTAPPPSPQELATLQQLALELDGDGLRAFVGQETAGWNRQQLLDVARGTLERVDAKNAELDARIEAARAEGRAEAEKPAAPKGKPSA